MTTGTQGGNVEVSRSTESTPTTTTRTTRSTRSSRSTPADQYDPYAVDPAAPRSDVAVQPRENMAPTTTAEPTPDAAKAEARVSVDAARRADNAPVDAEANATVTTRTTVTTPTTTPATPTTDSARVTARVNVTTDSARVNVDAPERIDSARIAADPTRVEARAEVSSEIPAPASRRDVNDADVSAPTPVSGVSPVKGAVLNDAHLFNILLLANAGDSARAAAALGTTKPAEATVTSTVVSPVTPVTRGEVITVAPSDKPAATVAVTPSDKVAPVTTAPAGEVRVTSRVEARAASPRGEVSALFPMGADCYWPTTNQHDDPKLKPDCNDAVPGPVDYAPRTTVSAAPVRDVQPMAPKAESTTTTTSISGTVAPSPTGATTVTAEQVREIAAQMQRDHTEMNARTATVVARLNVAPSESPVSVEVYNGNQRNTEAPVTVLDRAWLENEVRLHERSLVTMNERLLPSANDAELRQTLEEQKRLIETHLEMMRRLLGTAGTARPEQPMNHDMHNMMPDSNRMKAAEDTVQIRLDTRPPQNQPRPAQPVPPRDPYMMW